MIPNTAEKKFALQRKTIVWNYQKCQERLPTHPQKCLKISPHIINRNNRQAGLMTPKYRKSIYREYI